VAGADLIQESVPERLPVKRAVLADIEAAAPADALIASSTSGLKPTDLQAEMAHPERLVVGHPFNPVYLLPLVEVVGGEATTPGSVERAIAVYERCGFRREGCLRQARVQGGTPRDVVVMALLAEELPEEHLRP